MVTARGSLPVREVLDWTNARRSGSRGVVACVAETGGLPESLRRLIDVWRQEGATREEILDRLDQLELLAQDERLKLIQLVSDLSA